MKSRDSVWEFPPPATQSTERDREQSLIHVFPSPLFITLTNGPRDCRNHFCLLQWYRSGAGTLKFSVSATVLNWNTLFNLLCTATLSESLCPVLFSPFSAGRILFLCLVLKDDCIRRLSRPRCSISHTDLLPVIALSCRHFHSTGSSDTAADLGNKQQKSSSAALIQYQCVSRVNSRWFMDGRQTHGLCGGLRWDVGQECRCLWTIVLVRIPLAWELRKNN